MTNSLSSTFDDFFGKSVDGATGHAECLHCERNSSEGGGMWSPGGYSWVCDEHIQLQIETQREQREEDKRKVREHLLKRFGKGGRGYFVYDEEPGDTVVESDEEFQVLSKKYIEAHIDPNLGDGGEWVQAGWWVKIK